MSLTRWEDRGVADELPFRCSRHPHRRCKHLRPGSLDMSLNPQINDLEEEIASLRAELQFAYEEISKLEAEIIEMAEYAEG